MMIEPTPLMTQAVLAHLTAKLAAAANPLVSLQEASWQEQWNLRGNPDDPAFSSAAATALGLELPTVPNKAVTADGVWILWLGPDEWMITSDEAVQLSARISALQDALADHHHALTNVSDNRTLLQLSGSAAKDLIATGCGLDLRNWQPGDCAQSHFSRAQIILLMIDDTPSFHIYVRNSFADYLAQFMLAEMKDLS